MNSISHTEERLSDLENRIKTQADLVADLARRLEATRASGREDLRSKGGASNRFSRRDALLKVAAAGAGGVAVAALGRPVTAQANYGLQGDAVNNGSSETSIIANASFPTGAVLRVDANLNGNTANIDGLKAIGSGAFSGVAGTGGKTNGPGLNGFGGGSTGPGVRGYGAGAAGSPAPASVGVYGQGGSTGAPGMVAQGGGNGNGLQASAGGSTFNTIYQGTGVFAAGSVVGGGAGYGVFGAASGATSPAVNIPLAAGAVALGGTSNSPIFGIIGGPGLFASGGPSTGQIQLAPATTAGPPNSATSQKGELWVDSNATLWICTASVVYDSSGNLVTLGVWAPLQEGGLNNALFTAVSTLQYSIVNSDGVTWTDIDGTNLKLTITPSFNCAAVISGNSDLWTSVAGFNQDIGIAITGGAFPSTAGQPEAWKESGGFAGTFSPNAALVETVVTLLAGTTYTVKLRWKANKPGSSKIWAGAGPIGGKFSPTRLTAMLVATQ